MFKCCQQSPVEEKGYFVTGKMSDVETEEEAAGVFGVLYKDVLVKYVPRSVFLVVCGGNCVTVNS